MIWEENPLFVGNTLIYTTNPYNFGVDFCNPYNRNQGPSWKKNETTPKISNPKDPKDPPMEGFDPI